MSPNRYIFLQSSTPNLRSALGDRFSVRGSPPDPNIDPRLLVQSTDLSRSDLSNIKRDPSIVAIAPAFPTKLIEMIDRPLGGVSRHPWGTAPASTPPLAPSAANPAWGIRAVRADSSPFDGSGVSVAVLDTGINKQHAAFASIAGRILEADFSQSGNGDRNGHGTHVAGTIFGQDVNSTRIGVARNIQKGLIAKVLNDRGGGDTEGLFLGMQWADTQGADVISMSLGFDFAGATAWYVGQGYPLDIATSFVLEAYRANLRAFDTLVASIRARAILEGGATVIVAAAGNESRRKENPAWEVGTAPPAAADGVVSVGAIGTQDNGNTFYVADFSNTGPNIVGPGIDIVSAQASSTGGLVSYSGTSMATPHVAGVLALWADKFKRQEQRARHDLLIARLLGTAVALAGLDPLDVGLGIIRAPQA